MRWQAEFVPQWLEWIAKGFWQERPDLVLHSAAFGIAMTLVCVSQLASTAAQYAGPAHRLSTVVAGTLLTAIDPLLVWSPLP